MRATWASWRGFPVPIRLLVVNQLGVNVGFYMLLPFLAGYLTDQIGLSAALVGRRIARLDLVAVLKSRE